MAIWDKYKGNFGDAVGRFLKGAGGAAKDAMGAARYDYSVDPYWREQAKVLSGQLQEQAAGRGAPSVAETSLASALRRNMAQTQGNIRSIGGINPALRQRMLASAGAQTGADIAEKGGMLRAEETASAQNRLGTLLANMEQLAQSEQEQKQKGFQTAQEARKEYSQSFMGALGAKKGLKFPGMGN